MNDGKQKIGETVETKVSTDANRRKQGRGRGHSNSSRGRGVRANDQTRSQSSVSAALPSNGQLENSCHKVYTLSPKIPLNPGFLYLSKFNFVIGYISS